mgnify:CR=1 FL=1
MYHLSHIFYGISSLNDLKTNNKNSFLAAVNEISTKLTTEISDREDAEHSLTEKISTEISDRQAADNDNTYFKLRDVADAVGGFNVGFSDNTITIDTDTAAQPTPTPTVKPSTTDLSPLPELPIEKRNGIEHVSSIDVNDMLKTIGLNDYSILGDSFYNNNDVLNPLLTDIPHYIDFIPLDYYNSTIVPLINSLR